MGNTKKRTKTSSSSRKPTQGAIAVHAANKQDGEHLVGIGNLRVVLFDDDGCWFAQGLEIDYFAQGDSLDDVQRRFEEGLKETIDRHLKMFGDISGVLRVAPREVWEEVYEKPAAMLSRYSQVSIHFDQAMPAAMPFAAIDFYRREPTQLAA